MMDQNEKLVIAEGRYVRLIDDNGWEYIERKRGHGVVAIIAVTDEKKVLLVEQFRASMGGPVIELPAGLVGDNTPAKEEYAEAAKRELLEETGYEAKAMEWLTEGPSSTGLTSEIITFMRARELKKRGAGGGVEDEQITVHEVALEAIEPWLKGKMDAGVHVDPRIYIGLYFVRCHA